LHLKAKSSIFVILVPHENNFIIKDLINHVASIANT
jgi:hypothetical protein